MEELAKRPMLQEVIFQLHFEILDSLLNLGRAIVNTSRISTRPEVDKENTPIVTKVFYQPTHQRQQSSRSFYNTTGNKAGIGCKFCKTNGERKSYYMSHTLRVAGKVSCPVLRNYKCDVCGYKGGDNAHTINYCPLNQVTHQKPSVMKYLKAARLATGRKPKQLAGRDNMRRSKFA